MKKIIFSLIVFIFGFSGVCYSGSTFVDFTNYGETTTTITTASATSPVVVMNDNNSTASQSIVIQIYGASNDVVGKIQGLVSNPRLVSNSTDSAVDSEMWVDIKNGAFTDNGFFPMIAPITHIRLLLSIGTCKGRVLYQ